ncbi:AcrR family transcriptional regulator [Actinoalloteichus hoggarensis]|uniref:TetR/AcrR family transcriptional regulator n=1 Tax=Actinoalloteichus hoggarensis TaxID=1470176 RepID=UPI000B8AAAC5|nr:TetR/AcrR family transcriptional regulator [Actinoalloteichus hoggarensis]MBB5923130.1 AcrR family transcriptional regulator [Actinoalloteichus hoggarensis]
MSIAQRRERERADRRRLIVTTARELAEAEGWDVVTTRRLAERIEYSQPVLYSHFSGGKDEIIAAVASEGFAELAVTLRKASADGGAPRDALAAAVAAYVDFATANPAVYDAMFVRTTELAFGTEDTPAPLREAFDAVRAVFAAVADGRDVETLTEIGWSAVHGLVMLDRGGRLRPGERRRRLTMLAAQFGAVPVSG